jgi:transcriptional repressor NrdR
MLCPFCGFKEDKVIDSRESKEADVVRRRRECNNCQRRFTTYERTDEIPFMVVKKGGQREKFDRQKILSGLLKACEKRAISMGNLADIVDDIERKLSDSSEREIATTEIGELAMERLKVLDKVAYVRFASVYRDFQDLDAFIGELQTLVKNKRS